MGSLKGRDSLLFNSFQEYLGRGVLYFYPKKIPDGIHRNQTFLFQFHYYTVRLFFCINKKRKIQKYAIQGIKAQDFNDICKVAALMQNNSHITIEGLEQIILIKSGMNNGINN
jgi:hypothetical protein